MTSPQFVDLSQFQPSDIDWQAYKAWSKQGDGISRVAMRSSYGVGNVDQHFQAYRQGALEAGIDQIIYYHYAYPQLNAPADEANSQFNIVGAIRPQDMVILDFEENVEQANSGWAMIWLLTQQGNYGKLPGIYASTAYIQARLQYSKLAQFPLWLANWQFTPDERPPVPSPWTSYEIVQYTDSATNIPGINATVDADIFLGQSTQPQEDPIVTIDLTNSTVASHFTGGTDIWQCKDNGFIVGHAILAFYQSYGGNALCGLTYLGLPLSNETSVPNHSGVVYQRFERGVLCYDPGHVIDNPPGSGDVYLLHIEQGIGQDPRIAVLGGQITDLSSQVTTLQGDIAKLQALPIVTNLEQIQTVGQSIKDDIDTIMKLAQVQ